MAKNRYVRENAKGGWDVLQEGHRRTAVSEDSMERAVARAQELARGEGGGEVRIMNRSGKIADLKTVPPKRSADRR